MWSVSWYSIDGLATRNCISRNVQATSPTVWHCSNGWSVTLQTTKRMGLILGHPMCVTNGGTTLCPPEVPVYLRTGTDRISETLSRFQARPYMTPRKIASPNSWVDCTLSFRTCRGLRDHVITVWIFQTQAVGLNEIGWSRGTYGEVDFSRAIRKKTMVALQI
jgi:hypothetical protein